MNSYFRGKLASAQASSILSPKLEGGPISIEENLVYSSKAKDPSRRGSPARESGNEDNLGPLSSFRSPENKKNSQETASTIGSPLGNNSNFNNNNINNINNNSGAVFSQNCLKKVTQQPQPNLVGGPVANLSSTTTAFNGKKILVANYLREKYNNEQKGGEQEKNEEEENLEELLKDLDKADLPDRSLAQKAFELFERDGNNKKSEEGLPACSRHPTKKAKYQSLAQDKEKFCSKCAITLALKGDKIEEILSTEEKYRKQETENFLQHLDLVKQDNCRVLEGLTDRIQKLQNYYGSAMEKVNFTFILVEKMLNEEKSLILEKLNKSLSANIGFIVETITRVKSHEKELDKLNYDITTNFDNIVRDIELKPFTDIINKYTNKIKIIKGSLDELSEKEMIECMLAEENSKTLEELRNIIIPNIISTSLFETKLVVIESPREKQILADENLTASPINSDHHPSKKRSQSSDYSFENQLRHRRLNPHSQKNSFSSSISDIRENEGKKQQSISIEKEGIQEEALSPLHEPHHRSTNSSSSNSFNTSNGNLQTKNFFSGVHQSTPSNSRRSTMLSPTGAMTGSIIGNPPQACINMEVTQYQSQQQNQGQSQQQVVLLQPQQNVMPLQPLTLSCHNIPQAQTQRVSKNSTGSYQNFTGHIATTPPNTVKHNNERAFEQPQKSIDKRDKSKKSNTLSHQNSLSNLNSSDTSYIIRGRTNLKSNDFNNTSNINKVEKTSREREKSSDSIYTSVLKNMNRTPSVSTNTKQGKFISNPNTLTPKMKKTSKQEGKQMQGTGKGKEKTSNCAEAMLFINGSNSMQNWFNKSDKENCEFYVKRR